MRPDCEDVVTVLINRALQLVDLYLEVLVDIGLMTEGEQDEDECCDSCEPGS